MPAELSTATRREDGGVWVVRIGGEIDIETAPRLEAVLDEILASRPSRVLLEFNEVEFVNSTGIRALVAAKRDFDDLGARLTIDGLSDAVGEVFQVAGVLDSLAERQTDAND